MCKKNAESINCLLFLFYSFITPLDQTMWLHYIICCYCFFINLKLIFSITDMDFWGQKVTAALILWWFRGPISFNRHLTTEDIFVITGDYGEKYFLLANFKLCSVKSYRARPIIFNITFTWSYTAQNLVFFTNADFDFLRKPDHVC